MSRQLTTLSKQKIVRAIQQCNEKLGRVPTYRELRQQCGITKTLVKKNFKSLADATRAAGLEPTTDHTHIRIPEMLEDWGEVARKMGRLPSSNTYDKAGRFSRCSFFNRFGAWTRVADRFRLMVEETGTQQEWADVLKMIEERREAAQQAEEDGVSPYPEMSEAGNKRKYPVFPERPLYGAPLLIRGMAYEPVNEQGVAVLFGIMARQLGFQIERVQTMFPDCEAMREVQPNKWQRQRIEFEYESRNFAAHRHPASGCDVIVCWRHNWPDCPASVEVVELKKEIGRIRQ